MRLALIHTCLALLPVAAAQGACSSGNVSITVNSPLLWSGGACGSATFPLGPKALFAIDLGADAPLGQPMRISTCGLGNSLRTHRRV
jgi:hypothetical protein